MEVEVMNYDPNSNTPVCHNTNRLQQNH